MTVEPISSKFLLKVIIGLSFIQLAIFTAVFVNLKKKNELSAKNLTLDFITFFIVVNLGLVFIFLMVILLLDTLKNGN